MTAALAPVGPAGCGGEPVFATGAGPADATPSTCDEPGEVPAAVVDALGLSPGFYARHCAVYGIDVLASERVRDDAMAEAGRLVEGVLGRSAPLRDAIHDRFFRVVLVASSAGESLRDVPELRGISATENGAAGLGPDPAFPAATVRDATVTCRDPDMDPLATPPGDTLVHELGHAVLDMGLAHVDPGFRARLEAAYDAALTDSTWQLDVSPGARAVYGELPRDNYLMSNPDEYWATATSAWFGFKPIPIGYDLNDADPPGLRLVVIYGRDALSRRDPALAALLGEVFGEDPALRNRCTAWIPRTAP